MKNSARLYHCCRCHVQVIVCRSCDRGQRYCADGCSQDARSESLKRANQKYQKTRAGRFNNAARQASFRQRQKQKVTDQGSGQSPRHAVLTTTLKQAESSLKATRPGDMFRCHHCGEACEIFLRLDFLNGHAFQRPYQHAFRPINSHNGEIE